MSRGTRVSGGSAALLLLYLDLDYLCCLYTYWASVSEPHTYDFNATFSLCDRHCTSNIAINISIFHLGLIRGARILPRRGAARSGRPHPLLKPLPTGAEL